MEKYKPITVTFKSGTKKCTLKITHIDDINSEVNVQWVPHKPIEGKEELHEIMALNYLKIDNMKAEEILREYITFEDINQSETIDILPLTIVDCMDEYAEQKQSDIDELVGYLRNYNNLAKSEINELIQKHTKK